jgi:hypothetical protein
LIVVAASLLGATPDVQDGETPVTIRNINEGHNLWRPVIILHGPGHQPFALSEPRRPWRLGEKDETEEFLPLPEQDASVYGIVVAERVHPVNSPLATTEVEASGDALLSIAAMLSLTNDGFVAAPAVLLPTAVGETTCRRRMPMLAEADGPAEAVPVAMASMILVRRRARLNPPEPSRSHSRRNLDPDRAFAIAQRPSIRVRGR